MKGRSLFRLALSIALSLSFLTSSVWAQRTEANGDIRTGFAGQLNFLVLGPFSTSVGCDGSLDALKGNYLAPAHIACQFPVPGDIVDYDASDPDNASNGYGGPVDGGLPVWREFDDFGDDALQNLDSDVGGNLSQQMAWLVTYVEYLGDAPTVIEICMGSDDDGQVWMDNKLVINVNRCAPYASCQNRVAVLMTPGVHCFKLGVWEEGGGWGGYLGLHHNGAPVVDGQNDDFVFLGTEGGEGLQEEFEDCDEPLRIGNDGLPAVEPSVRNLVCTPDGNGGLSLSWSLPAGVEANDGIAILGGGDVLKEVDGDANSAQLTAAEVGDNTSFIVLINGSCGAASCSLQVLDASGFVKSTHWLALGPFANPFGCGGPNDTLGNHVAPSFLGCEYPANGDELKLGYDPNLAVSTGYHPSAPVSAGGEPIWRPFNDGSDNADLDFDLDVAGNLDDHVTFVATYFRYTGQGAFDLNLCTGSDDGVQIWINDVIVHNNNACRGRALCQDNFQATLPGPGLYRVIGAAWERGGGWGFSLSLADSGGGPLTGHPDFEFLGKSRPQNFEDDLVSMRNPPRDNPADCPECTSGVGSVTCSFDPKDREVLNVSWENPDDCDCVEETEVRVDGQVVAVVGPEETQVAIEGFPDQGTFSVEVANCSGSVASCVPFHTAANGQILTQCWLALGPIANQFGCVGDADALLGNSIAPSFIQCQYPEEGDEVEFDAFDPANVSDGIHPSAPQTNAGNPTWYAFDDGTPLNGDNDMDQSPAGNVDDHLMWLATYVEYIGDGGDFTACIGSDDDVQVWMNDTLLHNMAACRGRGDCDDQVSFSLDGPGVFCVRLGVWENGGGWGGRLAFQDAFGAPIVDGQSDEWIFHGRNKPAEFEEPPCDVCPPVQNLTCQQDADGSVEVSWDNPEGCAGGIEILLYGEPVGKVAGDETSFIIPPEDAPFPGVVQVDNGGPQPASCSFIERDEFHNEQGFISAWLHLGPYAQQDGNNPGCTLMRMDHLTDGETTELDIEPVDGDQIETDYAIAASLGLNPAEVCPDCNPGDIPTWKAFTDLDDRFNVNALISSGDNQMSYGMFYIDILRDITLDVGVASDDAIQVLAAPVGEDMMEIHCNSIARGVGGANTVQDTITGVELQEGKWKFMVKVFEGGGGHDWRLRFQKNGAPLVPGIVSLDPGVTREDCDNGRDDDDDGDIDCADTDCANAPNCTGTRFVRGDANSDGSINLTDGINVLNFLFLGQDAPPCLDAGDFDDMGPNQLTITDAIGTFNWLFLGADPPPPPTPSVADRYPANDCGPDPTDADGIGCAQTSPTCSP